MSAGSRFTTTLIPPAAAHASLSHPITSDRSRAAATDRVAHSRFSPDVEASKGMHFLFTARAAAAHVTGLDQVERVEKETRQRDRDRDRTVTQIVLFLTFQSSRTLKKVLIPGC